MSREEEKFGLIVMIIDYRPMCKKWLWAQGHIPDQSSMKWTFHMG